jgi:hypothetical protein
MNYIKRLVPNEDGIRFDPKVHKYYNKDNVRYISGTQFIGLFKQQFDTDFWSKFKSYEPIFIEIDSSELLDEYNKVRAAVNIKPKFQLNFWEYVKNLYLQDEDKKKILAYCDNYCKNNNIVIDVKSESLKLQEQWKGKSKKSLEKGTKIHNAKEEADRKSERFYESYNMVRLDNLPNGIYPEMILYNHDYQVAGTADKVQINFGNGIIKDYKSNEKLQFGYRNPYTNRTEMMKYPFDTLPDCSFSHYSIQLNLYGWMLEQFGYKLNDLIIIHIKTWNEETGKTKEVEYPVAYNPKMVVKALEYYKNEIKPTLTLK